MVHVGTKHAGTRTPSEQHQCLGLSQCHVGEESSLDGGVGMGPGCSENRCGDQPGVGEQGRARARPESLAHRQGGEELRSWK